MIDPRESQLQYELDTDNEAQAKRLRDLITASAAGDVELPRAHALIGRMCGQVAEDIAAAAAVQTRGTGGKYKSWLRKLPTDVAAVIAIRECIRMCTSPETHIHVQDLTHNVGKLWELEVRINQAEAVNPLYMQRVHEQVKEHSTRSTRHLRNLYGVAIERVFKGTLDLSLTKMEMMQLGKFGVDACLTAGLIQQVRGVNKNGTTVSYTLDETVAEYLHGYTASDVRTIISKEDTRMMCPPDDWTNLSDGGYLSLRRKSAAPLMNIRKLRKSVRADIAAEFTEEKMPIVFKAGNYMQSIPFKMHTATRDAIVRVWSSGGGTMGVPLIQGPSKPEFPFSDDWDKDSASESENIKFKLCKRECAMFYNDLREWRGRVREVGAFVKATREANDTCWFPMYVDTRGRWYYRGLPNPQGSDLAKAVIHFDRVKPLGKRGVFWLKVSIANAYGYDKERFEDRARWTEQNWKIIEAALDAPEDKPDVWGADAPWCMFSAAWELREAYRSGNPEKYCTGIPVHMDATCSGLQHFSALLRDPVGGLYVNLIDPNQCGPKQDIYSRVATAALEMIKLDMESTDAEVAALATWCYSIGISRALAKKPVMTYVYGATLRGTAEHVELILGKTELPALGKGWLNPEQPFKDCMYIARKLFQGVAAAVPAAASAMNWLKDIAKQQPEGKRMSWHTPTGFWVQHDYQDFTDTRVRLNSCGVQLTWVREWNEGTRAHAMQNAISPNFVHALDASHLTLVANSMQDNSLDVVAIHDSIGTHPSDVDTMHHIIREEFVHLYSRPSLLTEFLWEVGGVGEPPTRGSLDLNAVLESEFMFS